MNGLLNLMSPTVKNLIQNQLKGFEIDTCFTKQHNLGTLSDKAVATLAEAKLEVNNLSYTLPLYTGKKEKELYLSFSSFYNPVLTGRIAKQTLENRDIYRFLLPTAKGKLRTQIVLKVVYHCDVEATRKRFYINSPCKDSYCGYCELIGNESRLTRIKVEGHKLDYIFKKHHSFLDETQYKAKHQVLEKVIEKPIIVPQYITKEVSCYRAFKGVVLEIEVTYINKIPKKSEVITTSEPCEYKENTFIPIEALKNFEKIDCYC